MPPPKFVENMVILCFESRFSKQNSVLHLKFNILVYTAEYWQYTLSKTVYTFFIFRVWGEGCGTVATPLRTLVVLTIARRAACELLSFVNCNALLGRLSQHYKVFKGKKLTDTLHHNINLRN